MSKRSILLMMIAITGCGGKEEVSFNTLETARTQARENAIWNAQKFRATDPRFSGLDIISRGDSTQMPDCPQGDGWASLDFITANKQGFLKAKCSTVSVAVGCIEAEDFKGKSYAQEEGHCAPLNKVPFPLPKLAQ